MEQLITIFTPTFNRANLIIKLYEKLLLQTDKNFSWMIVDDGSTDNTRVIVEDLMKSSLIDIQYIFKANGGKQSAVNVALGKCQTEWFAFCDSDDWYLSDTIEKMNLECKKLKHSDNICGIVARRGDENLKCKEFPLITEKRMVIGLPVLYEKYKFHAETCAVFKTNALKEAMYPNIKDRFIPESYMFDKYSQKHKVLFINEVWSVTKYLQDGLTIQANKLYHENPTGVMYALIEATKTEYGYKKNVKNLISLMCWKKMYPYVTTDEKPKYRFNCFMLAICGYVMARVMKKPKWIWGEE